MTVSRPTRFRRSRWLAALLLPFVLVAGACSDDTEESTGSDTTETTAAATDDTMTEPADEQTIVDIAAGDAQFSTLVDLVTKAGLAETLSGEGPFTVFAPTNDAFAKVDSATLESLAADPTGALADVLKLHVIAGEVKAADAVGLVGQSAETLGGKVAITQEGEDLFFGGAKIVKTDIMGSNGVIHVLDSVVTAPSS